MSDPLRCIVMGAAGRDFDDFQMFLRARRSFVWSRFIAAQIPFIERRTFSRELAGPLCNANIPIFSENQLAALIARFEIDLAFLASLALGASPFLPPSAALAGLPGLLCFRPGPLKFPCGEERPIVAPVVRSPPAEEFL